MLEQKISLTTDNALEGVLISCETRKAHTQYSSRMEATKKYINNLMRETHEEAESIKIAGYQKGFEQGLLDVFSIVDQYVSGNNQLLMSLSKSIEAALEKIFSDVWKNDTVLLAILRKSINEHPLLNGNDKPTVFLPTKKKTSKQLITGLKQAVNCEDIQLIFHDADRYIIKNQDQMIEFNANEKTEEVKKAVRYHIDMKQYITDFQNQIRENFINQLNKQVSETKCEEKK